MLKKLKRTAMKTWEREQAIQNIERVNAGAISLGIGGNVERGNAAAGAISAQYQWESVEKLKQFVAQEAEFQNCGFGKKLRNKHCKQGY